MPLRRIIAFTLCLSAGLAAAKPPGPMLKKALGGPMKGVEEIIFVNRLSYTDGHWYANIGYYCEDETKMAFAGNGKPGVGKINKLNLKTGKVTVIFDAQRGSIRDPSVHYSGKKVLFSWRKPDSIYYNLYEINTDGSNLRQITSGAFDDYEATYLPDGDIIFVSTRCNRWVNCFLTQVGILYRCGPNGENIQRISSNIEHDNTPAVLPDGRVLFTRWEYVDRSQMGFHHLWTMNPDGTGQTVYYGNQQHYPLYIDARPIPGTSKTVGIDAPGHGRRDHAGYVTIFTDHLGPDSKKSIRRVSQGKPMYMDPYPFSADCFLVAQKKSILLMNGQGKVEIIHTSKELCHEPRPLVSRPRERVRAPRTRPEMKTGQLILTDVYNGRNMKGVKRGDIKKLLILESLAKPVNFNGGSDMVSWQGTFTLERVLGTVPVEEDGSASFELPANRPVFFVALDKNDMSVKRMQSFVSVMPGEVTSCVGCHEDRTKAPSSPRPGALIATQRAPSKIHRFEGIPDVLDYRRDIQPIWDKHCISCHNPKKYAGKAILTKDLGHTWTISWITLFARGQIADGANGFGNRPPRTIGTSASPLMKKIDGSHHKVKLSPKEWRTVWMWVESAAPYVGSYAGLRTDAERAEYNKVRRAISRAGSGLKPRCFSCHKPGTPTAVPYHLPPRDKQARAKAGKPPYSRPDVPNDALARRGTNVLYNLTRPELSPLLMAPLAKKAGGWEACGKPVFKNRQDQFYQRILGQLREAKKINDGIVRWSNPNFKPNRQYIREMKKYGILPAAFDSSKDPVDVFATDQKYWRSLE